MIYVVGSYFVELLVVDNKPQRPDILYMTEISITIKARFC